MEVFNMKKVTDVAEIDDHIRQSSEKDSYNDKVMFFMYDNLAFKIHELKGLLLTYVLQIDGQAASQFDNKNGEKNDEKKMLKKFHLVSKKDDLLLRIPP